MLANSEKEYKEWQMIGEMAVYRPKIGQQLPQKLLAIVVEYNSISSHATLAVPFQNIVIYDIPYSLELGAPGTWCFKKDIVSPVQTPVEAGKA